MHGSKYTISALADGSGDEGDEGDEAVHRRWGRRILRGLLAIQ